MFEYIKAKLGALELGTQSVMALVLVAILGAVGVITLSAMKTGQSASVNNTIGNATLGITNLTAQLPTVGTVVGVGLILGILAIVFYGWMKRE